VGLLGIDLDVDGSQVPIVPYAPSGTPLLMRAARKRLRSDANAYLLRNHGLICCGRTMEDAISAAGCVEDLARRYLVSAIGSAGANDWTREVLEALQ
jgi:L-fuculose-phosphate aldolase